MKGARALTLAVAIGLVAPSPQLVAQASAPLVGQATLWNTYPQGRIAIGLTVDATSVEDAMQIEWEVSTPRYVLRSRPQGCDDQRGRVLCEIGLPVLDDSYPLKVRAPGGEWSNEWRMAMIPCGYFIGLPVFQTDENGPMVGEACSEPPPAESAGFRLL